MISEKLFHDLNGQLNYEFHSSHLYLAMAGYCASLDLNGFANFFKVQAEEEKFHAMRFFDFIINMGGKVDLAGIIEPRNDFENLSDVFKTALFHEGTVTSRIYGLMDTATDEREHATISFLKWFIDEQVEEEANFTTITKKIDRIGDDMSALYALDAELATRVFTPPVIP